MSIKKFLLSLGMMIIMSVPSYCGTVEIQDSVPIYTVKEGQTLTEEEQRAVAATVDYFIEHPEVESVKINSRDFPSLSFEWFNNIMTNKLDAISNIYGYYENGYLWYREELAYAQHSTNNGLYTELTVYNYFDENVQKTVNFVNYCYDLIPQIGIYNGMDEWQAIEVLNNFVCDHVEYSDPYTGMYADIFETQKGTCGDYAFLFKALAEGAGIETNVVMSFSENHGWNEVIIDGQAYEIDTCWNDKPYWNRHYIYMIPREQAAQFSSHHNIEDRL